MGHFVFGEPATSCSVSVGSELPVGRASVGAASRFLEVSSGHAHQRRITSLAQIDSGVVEELLALVVAQLQLNTSG